MSDYPKTSPDGEYVVSGRDHAPGYNSVEKKFYCSICGEPWDSYKTRKGIQMTYAEASQFFRGKGCPACDFGKRSNNSFTYLGE